MFKSFEDVSTSGMLEMNKMINVCKNSLFYESKLTT